MIGEALRRTRNRLRGGSTSFWSARRRYTNLFGTSSSSDVRMMTASRPFLDGPLAISPDGRLRADIVPEAELGAASSSSEERSMKRSRSPFAFLVNICNEEEGAPESERGDSVAVCSSAAAPESRLFAASLRFVGPSTNSSSSLSVGREGDGSRINGKLPARAVGFSCDDVVEGGEYLKSSKKFLNFFELASCVDVSSSGPNASFPVRLFVGECLFDAPEYRLLGDLPFAFLGDLRAVCC